MIGFIFHMYFREPVQNYLADFFRFPYPLKENHFAKNPLAERGDTPPPLNGKSAKLFQEIFS